jgi:hypothetical protein
MITPVIKQLIKACAVCNMLQEGSFCFLYERYSLALSIYLCYCVTLGFEFGFVLFR